MIWLRAAAAVMIGPGCFGLGYWYFRQYGRRLELLKELKWFLVLLRGEIGYGRVSLSEACKKIASDLNVSLQQAFWEITETEESGIAFSERFKKGMEKVFRDTPLREGDQRDFLLWLGDRSFADEQMQITSINRSIDRLEATIETLEQGYGQYKKMTLGLGTLGGCLLLVILW